LGELAADPARRFQVREAGGVRVDTLRGGTLQLVPASALPQAAGERRVIRQRLLLEGDEETAPEAGPLWISLLWGCNPDPRYGATLGALALDLPAAPRGPRPHLDLELRLRRSRFGRLFGEVGASLAESRGTRRLRFAADGLAPDREETAGEEGEPPPWAVATTRVHVEDAI
jgi:hypothetical protein